MLSDNDFLTTLRDGCVVALPSCGFCHCSFHTWHLNFDSTWYLSRALHALSGNDFLTTLRDGCVVALPVPFTLPYTL